MEAWTELALLGGGTVHGRRYSAKECEQQANAAQSHALVTHMFGFGR